MSALMMFPTNATSLPGKIDLDATTEAVIGSLDQKDDDTYRRVADFLRGMPPNRSERPTADLPFRTLVPYCEPGPATDLLQKQANTASKYQRSKVWELLLEWRVPGSVQEYVNALKGLANDASRYRLPSDDQPLLDLAPYLDLEHPTPMAPQEWLDLVTTSKSDGVTVFFLRNFGAILTRPGQIRLARRLLDSNHHVQVEVANRLALMNHDPDHGANQWMPPDELRPILNYWLDFYRIERN